MEGSDERYIARGDAKHECCFCGETIAEALDDPVTLTLHIASDAEPSQQLFAHAVCLRDVVSSTIPLLPRTPDDEAG